MSRSLAAGLLVAALAACSDKPRPGAPEARRAVEDRFTQLGSLEEFQASEGYDMRKPGLPGVYWAIQVRYGLKSTGDTYWQEPVGHIQYSIGDYQIPGNVMHLSDFSTGYQNDLKGGAQSSGVTPIPVGATIVFDGTLAYKYVNGEWRLDEFQVRRRGYCDGLGVESCYAKHQIPAPAVPVQ
ncbi:MAG: hypothetical protein HY553_13000 [Elusimicrobia bacterium]|nr:hypothetical protein [Elusimicrobiota bacterium]